MFAKQDGSIVWYYMSPLREPSERSAAGLRFSHLLTRGLWSYDELLTALSQWATVCDSTGAPHRAIGFTELIARERIAVLREVERDERKSVEQQAPPQVRGRMRSLADILGAA